MGSWPTAISAGHRRISGMTTDLSLPWNKCDANTARAAAETASPDMSESRTISTTLAGEQRVSASVAVVLTLYFVGLDQGASSRLRSKHRATRVHPLSDTRCDYPATSRPGCSDRGGDSPKFLSHSHTPPGQPAQHHIGRTRIQIALKLTPDRFR